MIRPGQTILLIEDEESIRAAFKALLETKGFEVVEAPNGWEGVRLARKHLPDLIVCDVVMPELNGHEVLSILRKEPGTATVPFVFLTGRSDRSDLRRGMTLGADDYLTKPCTAAELLEAVMSRLARQSILEQVHTAEMKRAEDEIHHLLHYDRVTGLPNRMMLREQLGKNLAEVESANRSVAVLSVDLDHFSRLYQNLSHSSCDLLIQRVAERLVLCMQKRNNTVSHLSEDQFIIILSNIEGSQEAADAARDVLDAVSRPFPLPGQDFYLTCSIGVSLFPADGRQIDDLIRNAEIAMHQSKKGGGNQFHHYAPEYQTRSADRMILENGLRAALQGSELQVHYQPQVDLRNGRIIGAEALVRWNHPLRGPISPAQFIPVAEESGLISQLGEWVLRAACAHARSWQGNLPSSFRVAVNLSGAQFNQKTLTDDFLQVIAEEKIKPEQLEVEVTESAVMRNPSQAKDVLEQLKLMGTHISIDDFGTGYSSLDYLKRFPFDTLKIDQSFVRDVRTDSRNAVITMAMIEMAHNLNLRVVAEGVETNAELLFLHLNRCDAMQGFLFSRAVPATEFERLLTSGKRLQVQTE